VQGFHEKVKSPPGNLANGAVYWLSAQLLSELPVDAKDFSLDILPKLTGCIQTYETREKFLDIGTPEAYEQVI
jgi:mannose-1-phosphate guanylyltransferase